MKSNLSRRQFLSQASAAGAMATLGACSTASQAKGRSQRPPNIVFICTDDQGPWALGYSGNPDAHTPNLDKLFGEGAYLPNSYVVTPVCSPSRASTMCSRYGTEVGITDWINHRVPSETNLGLDPGYTTWPELLRQAGYHTGLVGKWHLGNAPQFHPAKAGFQYFAGFLEGGTTPKDPVLEAEGQVGTRTGYTTDLLTAYAIDFLRNAPGDVPFLLNVHYRAPHAPYTPVPDADMAPYTGRKMTIPNPDFPDLDVERCETLLREYLASVTGVDRNVGRILETLDRKGLADNTIVIFTSDNGYNVGHHGMRHKGNGRRLTLATRNLQGDDPKALRSNMFDTSLGVPTGIRWPGAVKPGATITETVSNLDWFPSLLSMAGLETPKSLKVRGRDFTPLLRGSSIDWDNDLYGEYSQHHYAQPHMRMYRTPEWKLVRFVGEPDRDELYHLEVDPGESKNLAGDPGAQSARAWLERKIRERMEAVNDPLLRQA
ncbi:MAG: sulfatase-like hydrolase/transferase [Candidatus Hydrogenedentes bacterium]|nr:sulfatase-like hydrolase/transferase [Candidatus Hydrogenedentota bacterium]